MSFDKKAFKACQSVPFSEQAVWFLNGFWEDGMEDKAEEVWAFAHKFIEIHAGRAKFYGARSKNRQGQDDIKEGQSLDQFQSHRFLEHAGETKTASELRKDLSTIDVDKNNKMSLIEYLMFKYSKTAPQVVNAPQGGGDSKELQAAEDAMSSARDKLDALTESLVKAQQAEDKSKAAQAEVKSTLDALNAEQKAYDDALAKLTAKSTDMKLGGVKRNRAIQELAQLKDKDPLPLNRAKLNQAAALKKAKKATKKAKKATLEANAAAKLAQIALDECARAFTELKKQGGIAQGKVFWMEREMKEVKKYMPTKRR